MNERIKQLAIEANLISSESNGFDQTRLSIAQQKFAELIVRECALTAGLMEHEGRPNIGAQILDNFGVES
jgi:hypothetical protein